MPASRRSAHPIAGTAATRARDMRVRVQHVRPRQSRRARVVLRLIRLLSRSWQVDFTDLKGLVRLRRRVAWIDRTAGVFGIGRTERFCWSRTTVCDVRVRVVRPLPQRAGRSADAQRVLVYLHGGGFVLRSLNGHMNLATALARAAGIGSATVPIYRLAPEHRFPAAVDDCLAAYRGILHRGVPWYRIALAGDSAGGGLVLKLLMRLRDACLPLPACGLLLSPFTDLSCSGASMTANASCDPMFGHLSGLDTRFYLGPHEACDPRCSPLFGDFRGLPPLLTQVGSTERLLDDSLRLVPRIEGTGGELTVEIWDQMPHVWHTWGLPESVRAIRSAGRFLRNRLASAEAAARAPARAGDKRLALR
jgi:epsilon-lactone hydrolase